MNIFEMILNGIYIALGLSFLLTFIRLLKGPSLPDRVVALDQIAALAVGAIAIYSVLTERKVYLDAALALALIAFLSTVAFAHYLLKREQKDE